jgi:type II secretory pathway component GspD/PulD (secretin)
MLTQKNKRVVVITALILICFAFTVYSKGADEINREALQQSDPFARFTQESQTQDKAMPEGPKPALFVKTATLKFLDATSLQGSIEKMSSEWGSMTPDTKSNSLIICDTEENLEKILAQISEADKKPEQIMIEVVLVDVKLDDDTEIGVNWDMLTVENSTENKGHDMTSFRQNLGFTSPLGATPASTTDNAIAEFMTTPLGGGSDFGILWGDIRNVIHMLQEKNNVEILASPRVMVVSGKTASINAGEEIPYNEITETAGGGTLTSTQFKNVGVKLDVTATLTDDRSILLTIGSEQKVQTADSATGVPVVDARIMNTSLLLEDGQLLVIGGLRRKQIQKQTNQLPILGDLPIIGEAFKSTKTTENNSELLVILSPHIYKGQDKLTDMQMQEKDRLTDIQMQKFNEITQRPLLIIPEVKEKEKEQKIKEEKAKEKEQKKQAKAKRQKAKKESKGLFSGLFSKNQ